MKNKINIWDVIAWLVLILILLWLILKVTGIINTPIFIEYAPYFGAVYLAGWAMHKLETATSDIEKLDKFKEDTVNQINSMKLNCIKTHRK